MDIQAIGKVMKFHFKFKLVSFLASTGVAYLGITFLLAIIMFFAKPDTYINLISVITTAAVGIMLVTNSIFNFIVDFNNTIKLGITRKNFIIGTSLFNLIVLVIMTVVISILVRFEVWLNHTLYSEFATLDAGFEEFVLGNELMLFLGGIAIIAVGLIIAPILLKFGGKGFLVIYLTLFGIFGLIAPNVKKLLEQKANIITVNFLEPISKFMHELSVVNKSVIVSVIALIALTISLIWLLRQDVAV